MSTDFDQAAAVRSVVNATREQIAELRRVAEAVGQPDEPAGRFATGGLVHGPGPLLGGCVIAVHPDECLIRADDARAGRFVCGRPEHPTETSDCGPNARWQQAWREHSALKQAFRALAFQYGGTLPSQYSDPEDVAGCEAMHVAARVLARAVPAQAPEDKAAG